MARQKATAEEKFMGFVNQIGLEKVEYLLKIYKSMFKPKKSLGTDPDPKAGERLNEPPNTTPTE